LAEVGIKVIQKWGGGREGVVMF